MALKTNQTAQPVNPTSALAVIEQLSPIALFGVEPPKPTDDLLPQLKVPYPIEMGETFKGEHIYRAVLFDGKSVAKIPVPYVLTCIAARAASRKLITKPDGKKEYERGFKALGQNNASDALYQAHCADPTAEQGNSYVLAVICDKSVSIVELPAFKLLKDYWGTPLYQALAQNQLGLRVDLDDHSVNVVPSKRDPSRKYLDPKKFRQHQIVDLTPDQIKLVADELNAQKAKFDAWLKR